MKVIYLLFSLFLATATALFPAAEPATIHEALYQANFPAIQQFINQNPNLVNEKYCGRTILHFAATICPNIYNKIAEIVQFLIDHNAPVNKQDNNGDSPLHIAARNCNVKILQILLDNGASIYLQNNNGDTPLHAVLACRVHENLKKTIKLLLERGASTRQKNVCGKTPENYAQENTDLEIAHVLQEWPCIIEHRQKAAALAFCEALHPRLGADSPAHIMLRDVPQQIFGYLGPKDFAGVKKQLVPRTVAELWALQFLKQI